MQNNAKPGGKLRPGSDPSIKFSPSDHLSAWEDHLEDSDFVTICSRVAPSQKDKLGQKNRLQ